MSSWSQSGGGRYQSGNDRYQSSGYGNSGGGSYGSYSGGNSGQSSRSSSGSGGGYPAPSSGGGKGGPSTSRQAPAPTPSSRAPAPSASGGSGSGQSITVTGCTNGTVSNIIKGTYSVHSKNHDKPVYKKDGAAGSVSVLMYFWDDRDGPDFSGWWFGPKVGGDQVWAYNGQVKEPLPPKNGWKVPWDGPIDQKLQLAHGGDSGSSGGGLGPSSRPSNSRQDRSDDLANKAADDARRREEQRKKEAQQQREREERRKQEADERQRREEEDRKRRERQKEEEEKRRKAAEERRKQDEERRKESNAALAIRKVVQKLRTATPETFDKLSSELDQAQAQNTDELGSQREKVIEEADKAVADAQKRVDDIIAKREADEIKRQEEEKKRKEDEERVQKLLQEMTEGMKETEDKLAEAEEAVKAAEEGVATQKPEEIILTAEAAEKILETTRAALEKTSETLKKKQEEMGDNEATRNAKKETSELHGKVATGRRTLDKHASTLIQSKEKAQRKALALKKEDARKEQFVSADKDKDGKLNRKEVQAFSKTAHSFDLPDQVLDKIMKSLEPIKVENFRKLHVKVALAKTESVARQKRAEEAENARIVEEKRQAIQKVADEAGATLDTAEATAGEAETKSKPLANTREVEKFTAAKTKEVAGEAEALVKKAEEELTNAMKQIEQVEADTAAVPELVGTFDKKDAPRLKDRHSRTQKKTEKVLEVVKEAYKKADQKAYAELSKLVEESVKAIRSYMAAEKKTNDQIIEQLAGGTDAIKQDKYVEFVKTLPDFKLEDGQAEKIFTHIAGEAGDISKQRFLELIRLYFKCVKATVLSEDVSIKSKTIRRLEVGETLECLEGPATEEGANVKRVKCLAVNDDARGWATIAGNQGTPFLLPGGNIFVCVKETVLSDSLSISDSKTIRRIQKGEVIEALEFPKKEATGDIKRIRGKAKQDGAVGWISVCGNQGTAFLEVQ